MASTLKIRNYTTIPLELQKAERFDAEKVSRGDTLTNVQGRITSFINGTKFATKELKPKGDSRESQDVSHHIEPFETKDTGLAAAERGREVLRLTFEGAGHKYRADVPGPLNHSQTMEQLDGGSEKFTTVYVRSQHLLAVFSSTKLESWMNELDDNLPLSVLSIPGTHNSPTCHVALPSVRCQVAGVREQLDNGVRFLDIRVSADPNNDSLSLVHSAFPISLTGNKYLHDLLSECYAFLDANPRESLLMSLKREGTGRASDQQMSRHLKNRYINPNSARWLITSHIPSLSEARGKIVLVRRFAVDDAVRDESGGAFGIDGQSWPDNCEDGTVGGGLIRVQDFYEIDQSTNIEKKISFSCAQLERAGALRHEKCQHSERDRSKDGEIPFFVNFLTASNFFNATCWPERIAAKVNPAIVEYLCARHGVEGMGLKGLGVGDGGTGIVVTDWVGAHGDWDLIRCVVGMNARLIGQK